VENAIVPIASAPKAAAASFDDLNIGRPLSAPCRANFGASLPQTSTDQPFQDVCTKSPKWFRRVRELFH
jgi:hypothetical protein